MMAPLREGEVDNCSDFEGERCHQILNSCPPCNTMWRLTKESSGQVIIEYKWGNKKLLCKTQYILKALNHDIVLMATKRQKRVSPYPCLGKFLICAIAVISASHTASFKVQNLLLLKMKWSEGVSFFPCHVEFQQIKMYDWHNAKPKS